ncbi:hypothetical protein EIM50_26365 [Pseudoxanthomonas sp. SGD-10]|nr:hypothetical protein EIM50_26365 [Pseudoxanthomonas sp. SGD-10]
MKKLTTSVSPFLMLLIPVIMIIGLSLIIKTEDNTNEEFAETSYTETKSLQKVSASVLIKIIANKF